MAGGTMFVAWVALNIAIAALFIAVSGHFVPGIPNLCAAAYIGLNGLCERR